MRYLHIPISAFVLNQADLARGQQTCSTVSASPISRGKATFARLSNSEGFARGSICKIELTDCHQARSKHQLVISRRCEYLVGALVPDDESKADCSLNLSYYPSGDTTVNPQCTSTLSVTLGVDITPPQPEDDHSHEAHPPVLGGDSIMHHCAPDGTHCEDTIVHVEYPVGPAPDGSTEETGPHEGHHEEPERIEDGYADIAPPRPGETMGPASGPIASLVSSGCSAVEARRLVRASAYVDMAQVCLSTSADEATLNTCIEERLAAMGFDTVALACLGCWKTLMKAYLALPPPDLETCISDPMGHHCGERMISQLKNFVSCSQVDLVSTMSLYVAPESRSGVPPTSSTFSIAITGILVFLIYE